MRRVARAHGFLDPIGVLAALHGFAQPSEVVGPWRTTMVNEPEQNGAGEVETVLEAVRKWVKALPEGVCSLEEEGLPFERVLRLRPTNPRGSEVSFHLSNYGTFGLYFGEGFAFEEIPLSVNKVIAIAEAIRAGHLSERVWLWRGRVIRTEGVLRLDGRELRDRGWRGLAAWFGLGSERAVQYEAW